MDPSPSPVSDADLVRRCLAGDRVAWTELLSRYADLVYGLLHKEGLDADACGDGFQEVSVRLWKGLHTLRNVDALLPFLATTTRRVAWRRRVRDRAREKREGLRARSEVDPGAEPLATLAALEEEQSVRRALDALADRCRRLLRALYFEPAASDYDAIAERLGIPRGSIGPTRRRCLEGLRRELWALGVGPDVSPPPPADSPAVPRRRRTKRGRSA
jgi:RNA polymerase sigma factor (sigma-70 family)